MKTKKITPKKTIWQKVKYWVGGQFHKLYKKLICQRAEDLEMKKIQEYIQTNMNVYIGTICPSAKYWDIKKFIIKTENSVKIRTEFLMPDDIDRNIYPKNKKGALALMINEGAILFANFYRLFGKDVFDSMRFGYMVPRIRTIGYIEGGAEKMTCPESLIISDNGRKYYKLYCIL